MAAISDEVETIILVMMENRSFDHMLGHLSIDTPSMPVNGLSGNLDQYENDYKGTIYPCYERGQDYELPFDLPHEYNDVQTQLRKNPVSKNFSMRGFVEAYANSIQVPPNTEADPMGYFPARLTPVTDFLARNFCICDNWFAPIPTSTQPNRTMAFSGDSSIYQTKAQLISIQNDIFHWMEANKIRWRVYHDGFSFFSLYNSLWPFVFGEQFRRTEFLYPDILHEPAGQAPQVIIIEPSYEDAPHLGSKHPNDNHAPLAVGWGEDFLRRTYQAVTANPDNWAHTVMVVYYDEHGGFYDHVPPPPIGYTTTGSDSHSFESLGPRIPGLVISPFVKPGSICSELFDHTSVLQFIAETFTNGTIYSPTVSKRKAAGIQSISVALDNTTPFPAPPVPTVEINTPAALGKSLTQAPSTEMGKSFELAALQMLEQKPAEVARKYPELIQWKDTAAKSGAVGLEGLGPAVSRPAVSQSKRAIKGVAAKKKKVQNPRKGKG